MKNLWLALLLAAASVFAQNLPSPQTMGTDIIQIPGSTQMSYTYIVPVDSTNVTLGVKDSTGALIRTIFAGKQQVAGTYSGIWDGLTDAGTAASNGPFSLTLLYGSPTYTWDGTVGNTSNTWLGYNRWNTFYEYLPWAKFTFVNGIGWTTQGLSEGTQGLAYFSDQNPNSPYSVSVNYTGQDINFVDVANDTQYLYLVSTSSFSGSAAWVTKFDAKTGQPAFFTNGTVYTGAVPGAGGAIVNAYPGTQMSLIDYTSSSYTTPPTSIAVQRSSNLLAVAHGNYYSSVSLTVGTNNVIKFFDKTSGSAIGTNATISSPDSMAFDPSGNLWVTSLGTLNMISNPSGSNTITQPISGLSYAVGVDVDEVTGNIYVLDGGSSQQIKVFNSSFTQIASYGTAGGYLDCNPTVTHNRLMLDASAILGTNTWQSPQIRQPAWIRVEDNGDIWVADTFDDTSVGSRIQHFTPSGSTFNYVNQIMYGSENYMMTVSQTLPTRVFIGLNEFSFNYNVPNLPGDPTATGGNNSWAFTKAWSVGINNSTCMALNALGQNAYTTAHPPEFVNVEQLSNGRVYANVFYYNGQHSTAQVELPTGTSPMRFINTITPPYANVTVRMDQNGNFLNYVPAGSGPTATNSIYEEALTGFSSNNPVYGANTQILTMTYNSTNQPTAENTTWEMTQLPQLSAGGVYVAPKWATYNISSTTNYPHLGGMTTSRSSFLWTTLPEICSNQPILFAYPCSNGSGNLGTGVYVNGHNINAVYGSQQSNWSPQFWHLWDDGMFIGTFGPMWSNSWVQSGTPNGAFITGGPANLRQLYNQALGWQSNPKTYIGDGQNMGMGSAVSVNGDIYIFVASESVYTPVQVWHEANLSSIHELSGTGNLGNAVVINTVVF